MEDGIGRSEYAPEGGRAPRVRRSWPSRVWLVLSGDSSVVVTLTFADAENHEQLRALFSVNGWIVLPRTKRHSDKSISLRLPLPRWKTAIDPQALEREIRSVVNATPARLSSCAIDVREPLHQRPSKWTQTGTSATAHYERDLSRATLLFLAAGEQNAARQRRWESVVFLFTLACAALLPIRIFRVDALDRNGLVVALTTAAVAVAVIGVCVSSSLLRRIAARVSARRRPHRLFTSELVDTAAIGAVLGLGVSEVQSHLNVTNALSRAFWVLAILAVGALLTACASAVIVVVRFLRYRLQTIAVGAAVLLGLFAVLLRLPAWAYFHGLGIGHYGADVDWDGALLLALPFIIGAFACIVACSAIWVVRNFLRSEFLRTALQGTFSAAIVVSLSATLLGSFTSGQDFLKVPDTVGSWAGFPRPVCIHGPDTGSEKPYWLLADTTGGWAVVPRHIPGKHPAPDSVSVTLLLPGSTHIRFVAPTSPCTSPS